MAIDLGKYNPTSERNAGRAGILLFLVNLLQNIIRNVRGDNNAGQQRYELVKAICDCGNKK